MAVGTMATTNCPFAVTHSVHAVFQIPPDHRRISLCAVLFVNAVLESLSKTSRILSTAMCMKRLVSDLLNYIFAEVVIIWAAVRSLNALDLSRQRTAIRIVHNVRMLCALNAGPVMTTCTQADPVSRIGKSKSRAGRLKRRSSFKMLVNL